MIRNGTIHMRAKSEFKLPNVVQRMSHNERDFDRLMIEELAFGEGFYAAFAQALGIDPRPIKAIRHSVHENFGGLAWGETDVFVYLEGGALMIENKVGAGFQPEQAARYRARAAHHMIGGADVRTVLVAPAIYLSTVPAADWDHMCSYAAIADCIGGQTRRDEWRRTMLREAGNRAAKLQNMANSSASRMAASNELLAFKRAWHAKIGESIQWTANPQSGSSDEFLYAPTDNPFGLRIWHHPFSGYMSVQNLQRYPITESAEFAAALPEGFYIAKTDKSTYLNSPTPAVDMTAGFEDELENVEEGMRIARQAIDLVETVIRAAA